VDFPVAYQIMAVTLMVMGNSKKFACISFRNSTQTAKKRMLAKYNISCVLQYYVTDQLATRLVSKSQLTKQPIWQQQQVNMN